jgi:hypothetical protein
VKAVRTDHGTEYAAFDKFCRTQGIVRQYSATYTPEQNGRAERLNRTIIETTRAILHHHKAPKVLWPEAVQVACLLRNYRPSASHSSTPYELIYGSKPDVSRLRVFGCAASVHIPKKKRDKLAPVSTPGLFVGYASHSKAWRVLISTGYNSWDIVESANVQFEEHIPGRVPPTLATDSQLQVPADHWLISDIDDQETVEHTEGAHLLVLPTGPAAHAPTAAPPAANIPATQAPTVQPHAGGMTPGNVEPVLPNTVEPADNIPAPAHDPADAPPAPNPPAPVAPDIQPGGVVM